MRVKSALAIMAWLMLSSGCVAIGGKPITALWGAAAPWDWRAEAILLSLIMIFLAALSYMVGVGFNMAQLKAWGKNELYQAIASLVIVAALVGLLTSMDSALASDVGCTGTGCHILLARNYTIAMYSNLREMNKLILRANSWLLIISSASPFLEMLAPPFLEFRFTPFAGMSIITDSLNTSFDIIVKVMIVMKAVEIFFDLTISSLYPTLLALGIVLRSFFMTRRLGGLLMAVAIGIYFILPLVYLLGHAIVGATTAKTYVLLLGSSALENTVTGTDASNNLVPSQPAKYFGVWTSVANTLAGDGSWLIGDEGVLEKVAKLLIYTTFVPFVSLITTISFVKILSQNLGGDIEIAGLTRLI